MIEFVSVAFIVLGAGFALIGSIGLLRFPDVVTRIHGPTKATTLGVGGVLLGTIVYLVTQEQAGAIREILVAVFLFLTAPVSAQLHRRCQSVCKIPTDDSD